MKITTVSVSLIGIAFIAAGAYAATGFVRAERALSNARVEQEKGHETAIEIAKLPDAVKTTATKILGKLDDCTATMEKAQGTVMYEVVSTGAPATKVTVKLTATGQLAEVERGIATDK